MVTGIKSQLPLRWGRDWEEAPGSLRACWETGYLGVSIDKKATSCTLKICVLYCIYALPPFKKQLFSGLVEVPNPSNLHCSLIFIHFIARSFIQNRTWGFPT